MIHCIIFIILMQMQFYCSEANTTASSSIVKLAACRTERQTNLRYEHYKEDTCARCYYYMPPWAFTTKFLYMGWRGLIDPRNNRTHVPDPHNASQVLMDSFSNEFLLGKWKSCCLEAWQCCDAMIVHPPFASDKAYCPRTWDGWQCWPDTPAGTTAEQPCKDHVYFHMEPPACTKFALKTCWPNGTWYQIEISREWTNYKSCGRIHDHRKFQYFNIATNAVSIAFMIPALIIFMTYKQLQVHRITMHKNLFFALSFNAVVGIMFKAIVILDEFRRDEAEEDVETVSHRNGAACRILLVLTKYFRMTTYMWMFCEGFYLHKLIAAAFAEQKNLYMFYVIGWVLPMVPTIAYAVIRLFVENESCWAFPVENYEWIMNAPNLTSLVVNLFFLCNIVRVLVTKLRATHANEPSQYRKAVRATLVLFPLFGLHFCLFLYRPTSETMSNCAFGEAYNYFNAAMDGLQGFMVSLIFCYLNGEVLYLLKRTYQRYHLHKHFRGSAQTSIMNKCGLSTTQVSTMNESQTNNRQSLHCRIKSDDYKSTEALHSTKDEDSEEDIV